MNTIKILTVLMLAWMLGACDTSEPVNNEPQLRPVRTFQVSDTTSSRVRTFSGLSHSTQESRLSFKVGGTIVELPITVGASLKKGQTVARLDSSTFELEAEQARAKLVQAQANQRNAEASYARVKGLYENSNASKNELDTARASSETAKAEVSAASKALEIARLNRSYTRLTASSDCQIATIAVDLNENVNAGTAIATVNCGEEIEIRLGVPEGLISGLSQGMTAGVKFNTLPDQTYTGSITEIGVGTESSAATFPVYVTLDNVDERIRPSMAAQVSFEFSSTNTQDAFVIPASAVSNDEQGTFVYLAAPGQNEQATVTRRGVEIGELTGEGIGVLSGLDNGDLVITAGVSFIYNGQTVLLR
ncbi:MAG: efflux RND transporter periplasmic adaptor subunit [Pseudomonadota bacterium]